MRSRPDVTDVGSRRARLGALVWLLLAACGATVDDVPTPGALQVDEAVELMATTFAQLPMLQRGPEGDTRPLTVAVLGFTSPMGPTLLGERVSHELSVALAEEVRRREMEGVAVITRYHLQDLLAEQGLSLMDTFADGDVPRVGELLGADYLITGLLSPSSRTIGLSAQMLGVADGVILGGVRCDMQPDVGVTTALDPAAPRVVAYEPAAPVGGVRGPMYDVVPGSFNGPGPESAVAAASIAVGMASSPRIVRAEPAVVDTGRQASSTLSAAGEPPLLTLHTSHDSLLVDGGGRPASAAGLLMWVGAPPEAVGPARDSHLPLRRDLSLLSAVDRKPIHVCLVIDTSGSMAEFGRMAYAVQAAREVLASLDKRDTVSLVAFAGSAYTAVQPLYASEQAKAILHAAIERFGPGGKTNFEAALTQAAHCFRVTRNRNAVPYAVLVSDGVPTKGALDDGSLGRLAEALADMGASLDTVGVGGDIRIQTMEALADEGNGRFHAVIDDSSLVNLVAGRVRSASLYLAEAATLVFAPAPGLDLSYVGAGWERMPDGTLRTELGLVHSGESVVRMLEALPTSGLEPGERFPLGVLTLEYIDRLDRPRREVLQVALDVTAQPGRHRDGADADVLYETNLRELQNALKRAYDLAVIGRLSEAAGLIERAVGQMDRALRDSLSGLTGTAPLQSLVERARECSGMLARGRFTPELRECLYADATSRPMP